MDFTNQPRKHQRIKYHDQVFVKVLKSTNEDKIKSGRTLLCSCRDMSVSGVCVDVPLNIPNGSRVEIWMKSPKHEGTVKVIGRVVWVNDEGEASRVGVQLVPKPGDDIAEHQKRVALMLYSDNDE